MWKLHSFCLFVFLLFTSISKRKNIKMSRKTSALFCFIHFSIWVRLATWPLSRNLNSFITWMTQNDPTGCQTKQISDQLTQNKLLNCFIYHLCWIKLPSFEQSCTNPLIVRHLLLLHPAYLLPVNILIRKKLWSPLFSSNQLTPPRSLTRTRSLRSWKTRPRWSCWGYV